MIIVNKILVNTFNNRKLKYYSELGYDVTGDSFYVDINHISVGSRIIVDVECDYCKSVSQITYKEYVRNISGSINKYSCNKKCGSEKAKESNLLKLGVINHMQLDSYKERVRETNLEKYGVEYLQQSDVFKNKSKISNLENWGVEHYSKTEDYKEKVKETNLKKRGVTHHSKTEDYKEKSKKTSLEKWGVDSYSKTDEYNDKIKKTSLENWGVEHYTQTEDYKEKSKKTSLENWGVDNPMKNNIIKDKIKKTSLEKWGVEYYTQTEDYKEKSKKTSLEKWGVDSYSKTDEYKDKIKKTSLENWGVEHYTQTDEYKEKYKKKSLEKWGVNNPMKSESLRNNFLISNHSNYIEYIDNSESLFMCDLGGNHSFVIRTDNFFSRIKCNTPLCTICNPIGDLRSIKENELYRFILSIYDGEIIQSYRDGLEIDIYLPNINIGFEFNGLYWHSEKYKDKNSHFDKTEYFHKRGIRIIHIWEDDWSFKSGIIKSQIRNWIGLSEKKIFARKCEIKEIIDNKIIRNFLNENHIQGYLNSKIKIGLYHCDELVSIMVFDQFEGRKKMKDGEWNLARFCNRINTNVIGGSSKLLKYFIKKYTPYRIISYADKDWSIGSLYHILGFNKVYDTKPDYKYIIDNKRIHKSRFRKSLLDTDLTESQKMKKNNILKIWDCGKIKYEVFI